MNNFLFLPGVGYQNKTYLDRNCGIYFTSNYIGNRYAFMVGFYQYKVHSNVKALKYVGVNVRNITV